MSFHPIPVAGCFGDQPHRVQDRSFCLPPPHSQPIHPRDFLSLVRNDSRVHSSDHTCLFDTSSDNVRPPMTTSPVMIRSTCDPLVRTHKSECGSDKNMPVRIEDYSPPRSSRVDPLPVFVSTRNLLHRVCFFGMGEERIDVILKVDPEAVIRKETVAHQSTACRWIPKHEANTPRFRGVKAPYKYPMHLCIASVDRILHSGVRKCQVKELERLTDRLIRAGPTVLKSSDGSNCATSLMILIKEWSRARSKDENLADCCLRIMDTMLAIEPSLAHRRDRQGSTPLHHAVQYFAPLSLVQAVYLLNPSALQCINMQGVTPFDVALRRTRITKENEAVVEFLKNRLDELHLEG